MRLNLNLKPLAALFCLLAALLLPPGVFAQTNNSPAKAIHEPTSGNRFLFIIDTSAAMKSSAGDMIQAVDDIIQSGASGQLHRGDTLGLWTFNNQLHPGVFPLQTWVPESKNLIAARTKDFLTAQRYSKQSSLPAALDGMFTVIKSSDIITVFIISTGQSPMQGTPFDDQINALYVETTREMKKNRKPIVTVLQAKRGKIIKYTVNALPWPVVIPEVPIPLKVAETEPAPKPAVAPETKPPAPTPPPPPAAATNVAQPKPPPVVAQNTTPPTPTPAPPPPHVAATPPPVPVPVPPPQPPPRQVVVQNTPPPPAPPANMTPPHPAPPPNPEPAKVAMAPREIPTALAAPKPAVHTNAPTATLPPETSAKKPESHSMLAILAEPKVLLIGSIVFALVGMGLMVFLFLRPRATPGPSLITRTMNQPPKK